MVLYGECCVQGEWWCCRESDGVIGRVMVL